MKTTIPVVLACAGLLGTLGLVLAQDKSPVQKASPKSPDSRVQSPASSSKTNVVKKAGFPVIGYLEGRDKLIIIKSGPKGPVYSVKGPDGKLLYEDLSAEQLQAKAPEVHQFIKSAVAINTRGTPLDASLRMMSR